MNRFGRNEIATFLQAVDSRLTARAEIVIVGGAAAAALSLEG